MIVAINVFEHEKRSPKLKSAESGLDKQTVIHNVRETKNALIGKGNPKLIILMYIVYSKPSTISLNCESNDILIVTELDC
jgi:hypothetical protein